MYEFETYKSVYCGLCKQLGKAYGPFSRLILSYDFTFLALLQFSLEGGESFSPKRCALNPLHKKNAASGDALNFSASMAIIMFYYKVKDNLSDGGFFEKLAALFALPIARLAKNKARKAYSQFDELFAQTMKKQAALEKEGCASPDRAADPTAAAMSKVCESLSDDEKQKQVLRSFGYFLGRWVYLVDAVDDISEDMKKKSYNPMLKRAAPLSVSAGALQKIKESAAESIYFTAAQLAAAYELLSLKNYKPILDNIIYLGLKNQTDTIMSRQV